MPPIFGILNTNLQPVDPAMIGRMKRAAVYVKPREIFTNEMQGGFMAAAVVKDNQLTNGHESMAVSGEWMVVADADLYRRDEGTSKKDECSSTYTATATAAATNTVAGDAAYILNMWQLRGKDIIKHLYGDFAFVIFNTRTGEVFCGRDHLGVRPLFYTYRNGNLVFASELRLLVAALPEKPSLRHEYLLDTLVTLKTPRELSPYENLYRLPPAHTLGISAGNLSTQVYWQLDTDKQINLPTEEEYISLLTEKLVNAVRMRCQGVSILGTELSGGLDSSAVTGIAADYLQKSGGRLTALSNVFPQGTGVEFKDEREFITAMQHHVPFNWVGVDSYTHDIPVILQQAVNFQGCFIQQNFSVFSQALYEKAGEAGLQVLLSGFGGDELVSARVAMPWHELIDKRQWKVMADEIFYKGISLRSLLKPGLLAFRYLKQRLSKAPYTSGVFTGELLDNRFARLPLQPMFAEKNELRRRLGDNYRKLKRHTVAEKQADRIMLDHLPQRMEYCYAAAAQYGIEYRYPLLDIEVVETALAFPPWVKQHHGINRYMFRQAIRGFVPEAIRQRDDKSGTTIPQTFYHLVNEKEALMDIVKRAGHSAFLKEIFDFSRFEMWYEALVKRDAADMNYLMPGAFYAYLMMMIYEEKEEIS